MKKFVIIGVVCLGLSGIAFAGGGGKTGGVYRQSAPTTYSASLGR